MSDMIKVDNKAKVTILVGSVRVGPKAEGVEVSASALEAMAHEDAGKAANHYAGMLKKQAGRPAAKETKAEKKARELAEKEASENGEG